MIKREDLEINREPYSGNDDIHVSYELEWEKDKVEPGTRLKFKSTQGEFIFRCLAHNVKIDKTWIDCYDANTRSFKSFHVEKLKGVVKPKRSRRSKPNG